MNCDALQRLYIRANGDVPCYDDAGLSVLLGSIETESIVTLLANARYSHIRSSLASGTEPWRATCGHCGLLRKGDSTVDLFGERRILTLQLETSLACNMRCPCCCNAVEVQTRPRPHILDLRLLDRVLCDLRDSGYEVMEVEYCGHGEPILHPKFPEAIRLVRDRFPHARQRLITNGSRDYARTTGGNALDEIVVSCDGFYQASYEQYRVGGVVDHALAFLRDAPPMLAGRAQRRVWKYLVFEFNDSDEELLAAQYAAHEMGIDLLSFVLTHSRFRSKRFTNETLHLLPLCFDNVAVTRTPHIANDWGTTHTLDSSGLETGFVRHVDEARIEQGRLRVRGWALSKRALRDILVKLDGELLGSAFRGFARPDVQAAYPAYGDPEAGFEFKCRLDAIRPGPHTLLLEFVAGDETIDCIELRVSAGKTWPIAQKAAAAPSD